MFMQFEYKFYNVCQIFDVRLRITITYAGITLLAIVSLLFCKLYHFLKT